MGVVTAVLCVALGAFVRFPLPFSPVPVTLQTFFVLLSAACLGAPLGGRAVAAYIGLGIAGLPLFARENIGWFYLAGPTAGYLAGFLLVQLFLQRLVRSGKLNYAGTMRAFLCADAVILLCGTAWLALGCGFSWQAAFMMGFLPFIPGDIAKAAAAAGLYLRIATRCRQIFYKTEEIK